MGEIVRFVLRRPSSIEVRITSLEPIAESDGEYGTAGESGVHDKCALEALNYSVGFRTCMWCT